MELKIESIRDITKENEKQIEELVNKTEEFKKFIDEFNKKNLFVKIDFQYELKPKGDK